MKISLVYPASTKNANQTLINLHKYLSISNADIFLSRQLSANSLNLTYGYLGLYTDVFFNNYSLLSSPLSKHSFILDHAFAPISLKGQIYRLAHFDSCLTPAVFNHKFLHACHVDAIHSYLRELASRDTIDFSIPCNSIYNSLTRQSVSLLIKKSTVLSRFTGGQSADFLTNFWLEKQKLFSALPDPVHSLIALKKNEAILTPSGKPKFRSSVVSNITLSFDTIREVFAPSSMFAVHFILHSIPVYLSANNPLYRLLGHFVPSMSSSESIELMMNTIIRSSISRDLLPDAGIYLSSGRL